MQEAITIGFSGDDKNGLDSSIGNFIEKFSIFYSAEKMSVSFPWLVADLPLVEMSSALFPAPEYS